MAWRTIDPQRQEGTAGPGRKAESEAVVYLHRTGRNPAAGLSLLFRFAPRLIDGAGITLDRRSVELVVDETLGLLRVTPRGSGKRKVRPPHQRSGVRWALSCSHAGELRGLFPPQIFLKKKTIPLKVVETSSEGITLELPERGGMA